MKRITILLIIVFIVIGTHAQDNFKWDEIVTLKGTKDELFLKAKKYISKKHGQQFADETNLVIYSRLKTKGKYQHSKVIHNNIIFDYSLVIMVKDNKIRLLIDDMQGVENKYKGMRASNVFPTGFDIEPKQYYDVMRSLIVNIKIQIDDFNQIMNEPITEIPSNPEW